MNKTKSTAALALALAMLLALAACGAAPGADATAPALESAAPTAAGDGGVLWASALYAADTELGEGAKTIRFECTAGNKTVAFTVHTDAEYLRAALEENGLISGDESEFGLYVKAVNGISADYDADGYYWSLYVGGEYAVSGVDTTPVTDGGEYAFVREAA